MPASPTVLYSGTLDFDEVTDVIKQCPDSSRSVFVVPVADKDRRISDIFHARAATLHNQALVYVSELSPLGITVLSDMLNVVKDSVSTAQLLALASELEGLITCSAYLSSVTKLQVAPASMWQHMFSWLPNSRFVTTANDSTSSPKAFLQDAEYWENVSHDVLFVGESREQQDQINPKQLIEFSQPSSVNNRTVPSHNFWGVDPIFEWVFAPTDLWACVEDINNRSTTCQWCNEPYVPPRCPVCSAPSLIGDPA